MCQLYKDDGGNWQQTDSFGRNDLLVLAYMDGQQQTDKSKPQQPSKPAPAPTENPGLGDSNKTMPGFGRLRRPLEACLRAHLLCGPSG